MYKLYNKTQGQSYFHLIFEDFLHNIFKFFLIWSFWEVTSSFQVMNCQKLFHFNLKFIIIDFYDLIIDLSLLYWYLWNGTISIFVNQLEEQFGLNIHIWIENSAWNHFPAQDFLEFCRRLQKKLTVGFHKTGWLQNFLKTDFSITVGIKQKWKYFRFNFICATLLQEKCYWDCSICNSAFKLKPVLIGSLGNIFQVW